MTRVVPQWSGHSACWGNATREVWALRLVSIAGTFATKLPSVFRIRASFPTEVYFFFFRQLIIMPIHNNVENFDSFHTVVSLALVAVVVPVPRLVLASLQVLIAHASRVALWSWLRVSLPRGVFLRVRRDPVPKRCAASCSCNKEKCCFFPLIRTDNTPCGTKLGIIQGRLFSFFWGGGDFLFFPQTHHP